MYGRAAMLIGIATPVVVQVPGVAAEWESSGTATDIANISSWADHLGFDYLTCSEHIAVPIEAATTRGSVYWDPLATLSYLAAFTSRIRLATSVVVLGYHHPLAIAKRYGTLDRISSGRLILGVGVGSLREEFDLLNASWDDRGQRADDAIRALRSSLSTTTPTYRGKYYQYTSLDIRPCAVQRHVPVWVGGRTVRSLHRAVELADGWMPFAVSLTQAAKMLSSVDIPDDFEVALGTSPLDPCEQTEEALHQIASLREAGATAVTCSLSSRSASHFREQLSALSELVHPLQRRKHDNIRPRQA